MLKRKMMLLATTLIASSLVGCFGGQDKVDDQDLSALRVQCEELSGFTGNVQYYPGGLFLWRADGKEVAECNIHNSHVHLVGILGHSHPGDTP